MITKPGRMVAQHGGLLNFARSHDKLKNHYMSSTTLPMAIKVGRTVAYIKRLLTRKS